MSVIGKAIWYIESHLSGDLSLEEIALAVGVSRFHLSRAFGVSMPCSLATYSRARRLTEAAKALAQGAPDILAIALDAGYGSHEAFTRAFRQQFGLTPEQVRSQATLSNLNLMEPFRMLKNDAITLAPPRLQKSDAMLIFGLGQRYTYDLLAGIPSQWDRFVPHIGNIGGQIGRTTYGVVCNTDDTGNCEYICGVQVSEFPAHPADFVRLRLSPQTYAIFEHRDHVSFISNTWKTIWNQALSDFGLRACDAPSFERYGEKFDPRTGLGGVEIWVPVKA